MLRQLDVEIGQEYDLEQLGNDGIAVDDRGNRVDQLDDQLGHPISGRGFTAEDRRPRRDVASRGVPDPVVHRDQMEDVQVLPLVLVQPLHLDVEHRLWIDLNARALFDHGRQRALVVVLDCPPLNLEPAIVGERHEPRQLAFEVRDPLIADTGRNERGQPRITQDHPAARGDPVGNVDELLRHQPIEVAKDGLLEKVGMKGGDAVDRVAADGGEVGHPDMPPAFFADERYPTYEFTVVRVAGAHVVEEPTVDLVHDL